MRRLGRQRSRLYCLPAVQWHRQREPDGGQHEVQSDVPALRTERAASRTPARPAMAMAASPTRRRSKCGFRPERRTVRGCGWPGKGNAGTMGAPPGDLYITTNVEAHPLFRREGDNIHMKVPITVPEAGLGAKIEVPTIDGQDAAEDSAGHAERAEVPSARTRRHQFAQEHPRRSDRPGGAEDAGSPGRAHQGTAARTGDSCIPKIRAASLWSGGGSDVNA